MAGESINYSHAEAFQDYIREFAEGYYTRMFYGFRTAQLAQPFEGVKGELVLTELEIGENLARRWDKTFQAVANAIDLKPNVLKTALNKIDFSIVPQLYEKSYVGQARKKGQSSEDWPFQAYVLDKVMAKLKQEFETAIWKGEEAAVPASGQYLRETFDGYLKLIVDAITANAITPVVTGAISAANAVEALRTMWDQVGEAEKEGGVDIMLSYAHYDNYRKRYKTLFGANPEETTLINNAGYAINGLRYELGGGNTYLIPIAGLSGSSRIVITPRENLVYGMDDPADTEMFEVEKQTRELRFWMDFRMGAQILLKKDGILTVNDQA